MKVSILTASLGERADMLAEAKESVLAQVCPDVEVEHLIAIDADREGAGAWLNRMLLSATGDWVMVLDDDDVLLPGHLATVTAETHDRDVIYTPPIVQGGTFTNYECDFDARILARTNCVSHNALMRMSFVREVGGWENIRAFDWDMFRRLEQAGAIFHRIDTRTWIYRFHGSNWSQGNLNGAPQL
jgi:glycosyltransferase involved in cell wall biosynthesis